MEILDAEAMLVRYSAAVTQLPYTDEEGRWNLLAMVVAPSADVLDASLEVAEERIERQGESKLTRLMFRELSSA